MENPLNRIAAHCIENTISFVYTPPQLCVGMPKAQNQIVITAECDPNSYQFTGNYSLKVGDVKFGITNISFIIDLIDKNKYGAKP